MKSIIKLTILFSAGFFSLFLAGASQAADFDPNYLISDAELANYNSLTLEDIQKFLDKKEGTLNKYITVDKEGNFKTAVQTFFETAQRWLINHKYLIVLTQKEMSLVTHTNPEQSRYDWATGYGCPDSGGCDERWRGFYKQVNSAAAQTRYYLDNIGEFTYQPGRTYNIDGQMVMPKNTATAALYNYTPHLKGNQSFWNLWNSYFGKKWPDGSLLEAEGSDKVYLIENGKKREIASKAILVSRFDPKKIIIVSENDLSSYENGIPVKFLNFSLLKDNQGNIYLISDDQKRRIPDMEIFKKIGFKEDEVELANDADLALYQNGADITKYSLYPAGALLEDSKTQKIYYVLSSIKKLVINKEILNANFQGLQVKKVKTLELEAYLDGEPVTLPDGMLIKVKTSSAVYVISNGKRLPILNRKIFDAMNYNIKNVVVVSPETMDAHQLGQMITGQW